MKITIYPPHSIHQIGGRTNNEDAIFPIKSSETDTLFMVCDGMGGHSDGEVASKMVIDSFADFFDKKEISFSDDVDIAEALILTERKLKNYITQNPESNKMGTTLSLLHFHQKGATVAQVGDSRVYQIREGETIFVTKDHTQVSDMVEVGIITPEEAKNHPLRNVLSRAIMGTKTTKADVFHIEDIQVGDYFFLCTDGILEHFDNSTIEAFLTKKMTDKQKIEAIKNHCITHQTKDNFSAYLIQIKEVIFDKKENKPPSQPQNTVLVSQLPPDAKTEEYFVDFEGEYNEEKNKKPSPKKSPKPENIEIKILNFIKKIFKV